MLEPSGDKQANAEREGGTRGNDEPELWRTQDDFSHGNLRPPGLPCNSHAPRADGGLVTALPTLAAARIKALSYEWPSHGRPDAQYFVRRRRHTATIDGAEFWIGTVTDYDTTDIPAGYDRARDHGPENLNLWMRVVAEHLDVPKLCRILDLGCGTGRFTEGLAAQFNAEVIGLDPSAKMVESARQKLRDDRVRYCRGRAEAIPVSAGSVDLLFMSMSFHHFAEPIVATRECRRVLRHDGTVMLRTGTREKIAAYPYTPFFPSIPAILEEMLPDHRELREVFRSGRLELAAHDTIAQTIAPNWAVYAEKLAAGGDSALARLSRRDFETGLDAVRRYGETGGGGPVIEPIDLFVYRPV